MALIDAAVAAVAQHGNGVDMDQVAAAAGVTKPVLYRYFADKAALWTAVGRHVADQILAAVTPAIDQVREERALIAAAIDAYLGAIEDWPQLYRFLMHDTGVPGVYQLIRSSARTVASGLATVINDRLAALGLDTQPAVPWAVGLVGFVQAAGDWWMEHGQPVPRAALTENLTALVWQGIDGLRQGASRPLTT